MSDPFGPEPVRMVRDDGPSTAARDMRLSTDLLADLARPEVGGRLRVHRPSPTAAFSRVDSLAPGYAAAEQAARAHGFEPVIRPAGGRLAAYHRAALVLDLVARHPAPRRDIRTRFAEVGESVAASLRGLGVPAGVGPVPGEYCPGEFSVHAGDTKLMGSAQRLTRHGYLFSAVLLVDDPEPVRAVLTDAYAALGFDWRPQTVGCVTDHVEGITVGEVAAAVLRGLSPLLRLFPGADQGTDVVVGDPLATSAP